MQCCLFCLIRSLAWGSIDERKYIDRKDNSHEAPRNEGANHLGVSMNPGILRLNAAEGKGHRVDCGSVLQPFLDQGRSCFRIMHFSTNSRMPQFQALLRQTLTKYSQVVSDFSELRSAEGAESRGQKLKRSGSVD